MSSPTIAKKPRPRKIPTPAERNRDLLLQNLAAGQYVAGETPDGRPMVPSRSDPIGSWHTITIRHAWPDAPIKETCDCEAMDGGPGAYHKEVVRWRDRAGQWQTNGVLPCSHILIARFDAQWGALSAEGRRDLLAAVPGLADAIKQGGQYPLPPMEA